MVLFLAGLALLIAGYFTYGRVVERIVGPDDRKTPAVVVSLRSNGANLPQTVRETLGGAAVALVFAAYVLRRTKA